MFSLSSVASFAPRLTLWSVALVAWVVAAIVWIVMQLRPTLTKALVRSHNYAPTVPLLAHIGGVVNAGARYHHHHPANWRLSFLHVWRKALRWLQLCPLDPPTPALPAVRRTESNGEVHWQQSQGPATSSALLSPHKPLSRPSDFAAAPSPLLSPMNTAATEPADPHTATASPRTQLPAKPAAPTSFSNAAASTRPSRSPKLMPTQIPDDLAATKGTPWASPASTNGYTSKPVTRVTAPTPAPSPSNTADAPKVSTVALTPSSSSSPPITPTTPSVRLAEGCSLPSPTSPPPTESLPSALQSSRQLTSVKNTTKSRSRKKTSLKRNPSLAISATHSTPTIHSTTAVIPSSPTTSHCSTALPTKGQHSTDRLENDTPAPLLRPTARLGHLRTSPPLTHPKESVPESSHLARSTAPVAELAVNSQPLSEELFAHCQPIHRPKAVGRRSSSSLMFSSTTTGRSSPSHKMVTRSLEPSPELRARLSTATTSPRIRPLDPLPKASAASLHSIYSSDASQACRRPVSTAKWFSPFDPHWQVSLDFLRSERQRQSRCRPPPGFPATPAGTTRPPPHSLTQHRPASMMWDGFNAISTRHQRSASEQTSMPRPPPGLTNFGPGQDMPSSNVLPLRTSLDQSLLTASQSVLLQEEATANLLPRGPSPVGFGLTSSLAMSTPPLRYNLSSDGCLATVNDHQRPFTANAGGVVGYGTGNSQQRSSMPAPMLPPNCWNPTSSTAIDPQPMALSFHVNGPNSAMAARRQQQQQSISEARSLPLSGLLSDSRTLPHS